jgi:hypothetical protein
MALAAQVFHVSGHHGLQGLDPGCEAEPPEAMAGQ